MEVGESMQTDLSERTLHRVEVSGASAVGIVNMIGRAQYPNRGWVNSKDSCAAQALFTKHRPLCRM